MPTWLIVVLCVLAVPAVALLVLFIWLGTTKSNPFQ